jgi:hypothetical protein
MDLSETVQNRSNSPHRSVLLNEVIEYLSIKDGGRYLDCTFGAGGYTRAILSNSNCYVTALDQDPTVINFANDVSSDYGDRFNFIQTNFSEATLKLKGQKFDGIVLDLGMKLQDVVFNYSWADILICTDPEPDDIYSIVNTGFIIVKNTAFSRSFLKRWWTSHDRSS